MKNLIVTASFSAIARSSPGAMAANFNVSFISGTRHYHTLPRKNDVASRDGNRTTTFPLMTSARFPHNIASHDKHSLKCLVYACAHAAPILCRAKIIFLPLSTPSTGLRPIPCLDLVEALINDTMTISCWCGRQSLAEAGGALSRGGQSECIREQSSLHAVGRRRGRPVEHRR